MTRRAVDRFGKITIFGLSVTRHHDANAGRRTMMHIQVGTAALLLNSLRPHLWGARAR
jgi:hypothetical protein